MTVPPADLPDADVIAERIRAVRDAVAEAADRSGRDPAEVTVVGVGKTFDATTIAAALSSGVVDLGENRAQELLAKHDAVESLAGRSATWHFVGRLQRNKVRSLAGTVDVWHSVDRAPLADEIARRSPGARVFVQVKLGGEESKGGCDPVATGDLVGHCRDGGLDVCGLMAVPPPGQPCRPHFAFLRDLATGLGLAGLSMGMTDDYAEAVEEGATHVRVGRALFGGRPGPGTAERPPLG